MKLMIIIQQRLQILWNIYWHSTLNNYCQQSISRGIVICNFFAEFVKRHSSRTVFFRAYWCAGVNLSNTLFLIPSVFSKYPSFNCKMAEMASIS